MRIVRTYGPRRFGRPLINGIKWERAFDLGRYRILWKPRKK